MPAEAERKMARQGGAARYRTIKRGDKTFTCAVTRKTGPKGGKTVCWPKESLGEGRDDLANGTIKLGPAAKKYATMTSKDAMKPGWKVNAYLNAAAEVSGQKDRQHGFKNKDAGEQTGGKKLAEGLVRFLLQS